MTPYILPLLGAALLSTGVMFYTWQRRSTPNAIALSATAFAITEWLLGYALELSSASLEGKIAWGKLQYIGIALIPVTWFIFSFAHTQPGRRIAPHYAVALFTIPSLTILLALTTEQHGLIWKTMQLAANADIPGLAVTYGPWFWVHSAYSYLILLVGAVLMLRSLRRSHGLYRGQLSALIIGVAAPWLGNILYLSGVSPIPYLDLTPFAFSISVAALAWGIWGIWGYRLIDITPIARDLIFDGLREGVIVINQQGQIVDLNPSATRIIGLPASMVLGKPYSDVLTPWPDLIAWLQTAPDQRLGQEIAIGQGEARIRYAIELDPLIDYQQQTIGQVMTLRHMHHDAPPLRAAPTADTPPQSVEPTLAKPSLWNRLVRLILVETKDDLFIPPTMNRVWYQTQERIFTSMMRLAALLGLIALFMAQTVVFPSAPGVYLINFVIVSSVGLLGIARNIDFAWRRSWFVMVIYGLSLVEIINYGFSLESFTYLFGFIVISALLITNGGGLVALLVSFATLGIAAWLIGTRIYIPRLARIEQISPNTFEYGITSTIAFLAVTSAASFAIHILLRSLNQAWQTETQTRYLLEQERDMLEQRIKERTSQLSLTQQELLQKNADLRKYYRALEQSGNTIVITDIQGNIEYVNPHFVALTGYTMEEAMGKNTRIMKSGEQGPEFYQQLWQTIQAGNIWRGEFHNRRKDGSLFWERATIAPIQDDDGKVTHYVAVKEDITEIRQLQILAEEEHARAEALLLNILPAEIAQRLKLRHSTMEPIADYMPSVSILFADLVDFTTFSARLQPEELVGILDSLFSQFDSLVDVYGLEKIKTIGDSYMVAAGVPKACKDHAILITRLAIDMIRVMTSIQLRIHAAQDTDFAFKIRIGINSGPVVAGVLGRQKFIYDLWGDTVNVASRMESHGQSNMIQVTEATYHLIQQQFICEPRGLIEVKGKGMMPVWVVVGEV
nr:histidine kinase N-terminal 7TM domain-containing protein [Oscillochloris trichoides]